MSLYIKIKENCIHFIKIFPFLLFISTYFQLVLRTPNLVSDFTLNKFGFLLLFILEIVGALSIIIWALIKFKVSVISVFAYLIFAFPLFLFFPLAIVHLISKYTVKYEIIPKNYIGLSKYETSYEEDRNGQAFESVTTYPNRLYEISDEKSKILLEEENSDGEYVYQSQEFIYWQTSIIYGYDIDNVQDLDNIEYSERIILNLSLLPFLILECLIDGIPMLIILMGITIICYFFNYRFPFSTYSSLRKYLNESGPQSRKNDKII